MSIVVCIIDCKTTDIDIDTIILGLKESNQSTAENVSGNLANNAELLHTDESKQIYKDNSRNVSLHSSEIDKTQNLVNNYLNHDHNSISVSSAPTSVLTDYKITSDAVIVGDDIKVKLNLYMDV